LKKYITNSNFILQLTNMIVNTILLAFFQGKIRFKLQGVCYSFVE